jgi:hypothetical protein
MIALLVPPRVQGVAQLTARALLHSGCRSRGVWWSQQYRRGDGTWRKSISLAPTPIGCVEHGVAQLTDMPSGVSGVGVIGTWDCQAEAQQVGQLTMGAHDTALGGEAAAMPFTRIGLSP